MRDILHGDFQLNLQLHVQVSFTTHAAYGRAGGHENHGHTGTGERQGDDAREQNLPDLSLDRKCFFDIEVMKVLLGGQS